MENNSKSGNSLEEVPFEEELREIGQADDSIEPEVLRSQKFVQYPKKLLLESTASSKDSDITDDKENVEDPSPKKERTRTLSNEERKLEFFKQKEAKKRKHQEKLQILRELFNKKESD